MELAPCKYKNTETECVIFTIALAGRGVIGGGGLPRVSLRLPWAKEVIGLSARLDCQGYTLPFTFQPAWVDRDKESFTRSWYAKNLWKSAGSVGDN